MLECFGFTKDDQLSALAEVTSSQVNDEIKDLSWTVDGVAHKVRIKERGQI